MAPCRFPTRPVHTGGEVSQEELEKLVTAYRFLHRIANGFPDEKCVRVPTEDLKLVLAAVGEIIEREQERME